MARGIVITLTGLFVIGHVVWGDWDDRITEAVGLS